MTPEQLATLNAHIRANQNAAVVAALAIRDDDTIRDWYNGDANPTTLVWRHDCTRQELFEAMSIPAFSNLANQGDRDAWMLLLDQASIQPIDFGRPKMRNAVRSIWATAQADSILTDCTRKATRAEMVFGGASETSGTITATDLVLEVTLTSGDVSAALNLGA